MMNQRDAVVTALTEQSLTMDELIDRVAELTGEVPKASSLSVVMSKLRMDEGRTIISGGRIGQPTVYNLRT